MHYSEINPKIRQLICQKGYTIYRLAKESSIPLSTLYGIRNNECLPSIHTLILICRFFNISMSEFFLESHMDNQVILTLSEKKHISLYRSISPILQDHVDNYLRLLEQNTTTSY